MGAIEIHVSSTGDDSNPGTPTAPLRTLQAAQDRVRTLPKLEPVTVVVASGIHYLDVPLVLGPEDSGAPDAPVVWRATSEGQTILSGGLRFDGTWSRNDNGVWQLTTAAGLELDQLFINGRRMPMARYPNETNRNTDAWNGFAEDAFSDTKAAGWSDPSGGFMHAMHAQRWGGYHYRILGKNGANQLSYEGGWQNNRPSGMHPQFRMVENIREELDAPGEWFHDRTSNTLFHIPLPGTDLTSSIVEGVRLASLIELRGSAQQPVRHVAFQGFVFRHTARTFMETREPLLRSDWTIYRGGTVFLTGTEDVTISDCEFDQAGGNAIFFSNYNRRALVRGCHIHDCGGSGVAFVGDPDAVHNPLFQYGQTQDLLATDTAIGPKTPNYPSDSTVENCLIHGVGRIERQTAAVQISMSRRITVRDVSIYDCSRAGINISEGTWGGHLLEGLDVFDTVLETDDHGSFNSWGRDRFWHPNRGTTDSAVAQRPDLPFLDACETTVIRNSRWRCDHGWDIDLDDGSSNYDIYNNLLLNRGIKFREGYRRRAWNNIFVNNGFHPHVWYQNSNDSFARNIIMRAPSPVGLPSNWHDSMSANFFASNDAVPSPLAPEIGGVNSFTGRANFLNPAVGDYRVAPDSPALQVGFENFPMDQFGVKKPALRSIARTPALPTPNYATVNPELAAPFFWRGAMLFDLRPGQFSAFGTREEDGGVAVANVASGSSAATAGLLADDLIQGLNGHVVRNLQDLSSALLEAGNHDVVITYVRNQQPPAQLNAGPESLRWSWQPGATFQQSSQAAPFTCETNPATANDLIAVLADNGVNATYGPVFANGVSRGYYRIRLQEIQGKATLELWSHHHSERRGHFRVTIFAASGDENPGWRTEGGAFQPIASMVTTGMQAQRFNRLALEIKGSEPYRWLLIETLPLNSSQEHTSYQEIRLFPEVDHIPGDENIIQNGDFEIPPTSNLISYPPGATTLPGWSLPVPSDGVQLGRPGIFGSNNGTQNLQLTGGARYSSGGSISQNIETIAGRAYQISIDLASRAGNTATGIFSFGGQQRQLSQSSKSFTRHVWQATASSAMTQIQISGSAVSASEQLLIDNVSVTPLLANYSRWRSENFPVMEEFLDDEISGPNAVLLEDGVDNLFKYAFGLPVRAPHSKAILEIQSNQPFITFRYARPGDRGDMVYHAEFSHDLMDWSDEESQQSLISETGNEQVWKIAYLGEPCQRLFARVKVRQK